MEQKTKLSEIKPNKDNPRQISADALEKLKASINRDPAFMTLRPIVVDENGVILGGNMRYRACVALGMTEVPADWIVKAADLTQEQKQRFILVDNAPAGMSGEWDYDSLSNLWDTDDLLDIGFTPGELGMGFELPGEPPEEDELPPPPADPITKPGDLILLGDHRLLCGDSIKEADVKKLMDGKKADMVFTDPPYNVDYGSSKKPRHKIRGIANDKQSSGEWESFCRKLFEIFKNNNTGDIYMWGASSPEGMKMRLWLTEAGCHWSATIVWKKQQLVLSPANYQRMYEPCFYGWFGKSSFCADRKQTEVWEIDRPRDSKLHPTMKPVELCSMGINNSSKKGNIVLDLFGGSGSTLIAAEQLKRRCYMMELDPGYCDVIVQRWESLTGKKAVRPLSEAT